ncbi:MAG: glycine cleavage system protein GcvH [Thermoanaerobaculia bacterium]|nr:glycine cleavage system protein GcvH [Thermoanaerobaculia bacterium]
MKFAKSHEYVSVEGDVVVIGISDYAQSELGDVVFVELPQEGSDLEKGEEFGSIESVKAVSELFAPVSGEIIEVNDDLSDSPELVNSSPYEDGWMLKVKMTDENDLDDLMDEEQYKEYVEKESD